MSERAAERARLAYVRSDERGIVRRRAGKGFVYFDANGVVRDRRTLERIRALVIPPAWEDVWICARADGHIQATGRDARGRKQYRYHAAWRDIRDEAKFDALAEFAGALPMLRSAIDRDLAKRGLPRSKVLAAIVRLLELTLIRVGNDEYARANASYGLTTLECRHVVVRGARMQFEFVAKGGVQRRVELVDRRIARIVRQCCALPGCCVFKSEDGAIDSSDVNAYIQEIAGNGFTAKAFRTWGATVFAARTLYDLGPPSSEREAKKRIDAALVATADRLGNTKAVCRASYVHPIVIASYRNGELERAFARARDQRGLRKDERAVLALVRRSDRRARSTTGVRTKYLS